LLQLGLDTSFSNYLEVFSYICNGC